MPTVNRTLRNRKASMFVSLMTDILLCHLFYSIFIHEYYTYNIHLTYDLNFLCSQVGFLSYGSRRGPLCFVLFWMGIVANNEDLYMLHSWTDSYCLENSSSTKQNEQKQSDLIFTVYLSRIIFHFVPNTLFNNKSFCLTGVEVEFILLSQENNF